MTTIKKMFAILGVILIALVGLGIKEVLPQKPMRIVTITHVVQPGETFWDITEKYCRRDCREKYLPEFQDEVRAINPVLVERQNQLQPGDVITIQYFEEVEDEKN